MSDPDDDRTRDDRESRSGDDRPPADESDEGEQDRLDNAPDKPGTEDREPRTDASDEDRLGPEGEIGDEPGRYEGVGEEIGAAGGPDPARGEASGEGGVDAPGETTETETRDYEGATSKPDDPPNAGQTIDRTDARRSGAEGNREGGPTAGRRDEGRRTATEQRRRNVPVVAGVVAVVGAWVAVSPLVLEGLGQAGVWNNVLVGLAILATSGYNYYRLTDDRPLSVGVAALSALLGLWLIVAPLLFETTGAAFWITAVSGLLVAGLAGYDAYEGREARAETAPEAGTR